MATKAPAAPQDDFNLDDIKLDDFPMEDNALFADLDNEMRADGGGKAGGDDLDLNLDLDSGSGDAMPALEEPGELKIDDTMDLDLNLDDAPQAEAGGGDLDLDLNLDEPTAEAESAAEPDLDLNLDLDDGGNTGGADLKLDDDLDLNLDEPEAPTAEASSDMDLDLDAGSLDLNLDDAPAAESDSLSLDEPGELSLSMDEPSEPNFDMDLPDEPSLSLDSDTPAEDESDGISLSVVGPEPTVSSMDTAEPDLDMELPPLDDEPAAPEMAAPKAALAMTAPAAAAPEMELTLDEGFSLDDISEGAPGGDEQEASAEFQAAPDVNLDDIDLSLDGAGEPPALEPMGAKVDFASADASAPTMDEGFDLPPLAETKGDVETGPAEPFVAVPDVKLTEDEVLELNLPQQSMHDEQPDFTMEPEPMPMGGDASEFRLTEPLAMAAGAGMAAAGMAATRMAGGGMGGPKATSPMMAPSSMSMSGGTGRPPREAAVSQDILLSIPHKISVQMGQVNLVGKDIRNLAYGSVVQLNRTVGEPVDLLLDGKSIAQGEIVLINGKNLGVRILALNK